MRLALVCVLLAAVIAVPDGRAQHAEAPPAEVRYVSGEAELVATIRLPAGEARVPGVVLVHGSGTSDRSNPWTSAWADALVARGIAVLHPDKRGSGASGGSWRAAGMDRLADDALAGLDVLRTHPRIDTARVGLIGFSQGGHVAPLAAARSPGVAFVVSLSGSVVPMAEQIGDEIRMMGEREGVDSTAALALRQVHEHAIAYARSGDGWEAYARVLAAARGGVLRGYAVGEGFPSEPDSPAWAFLRHIVDYDPLPHWQQVRVPVLFVYGGRDEQVDVYRNARVIEQELGALSYTLVLFRENGHALYREDALDLIARWVHDGGRD